MQTRITLDEIRAASRQLAKHERGRAALKILADALKDEDLCLDLLDQRAFLALLGGAWHGQRTTVREVIHGQLALPVSAPREDGASDGAPAGRSP